MTWSLSFLFKVWFLQNSKIATPSNRKSWPDLSKPENFARGKAFDHHKKFYKGFAWGGGMLVFGIDWCITWHRLPALQISMLYDVWIKFHREGWKNQSVLRDRKPSANRVKRSFYPYPIQARGSLGILHRLLTNVHNSYS